MAELAARNCHAKWLAILRRARRPSAGASKPKRSARLNHVLAGGGLWAASVMKNRENVKPDVLVRIGNHTRYQIHTGLINQFHRAPQPRHAFKLHGFQRA